MNNTITNKIIKTGKVDWRECQWLQPDNLKKYSENQWKKLKTSLVNNGFMSPFILWENKDINYILDAHHRQKAFKELEEIDNIIIPDKLPAVWVDCKNKKEAKKAILIYNSHYADLQQYNLIDWIKDLNFEDINNEIDIKGIDITEPLAETQNDDEVPENVKVVTKLGDLWELGRHRVLCGDSTKVEYVEKLMNGQKADMVFTDPPYGIDYEYKTYNDIQGNKYLEFCEKWFTILKDKSQFIFLTAGWKYNKFWILKEPSDILYWISRNKQSGGKLTHFRKIEPIFLWSKIKVKYNLDYFDYNSDRLDGLREKHSCPKPVKFIQEAIDVMNKDSIILDIFLGSGSTLIACEKTNRICYGMELDEHYCDVIVNRYNDWCIDNNIKPEIKLNGKKYNIGTTG